MAARASICSTDIVMPGALDGRQLAERVTQHWPGVRVLYMSGYADHLSRGEDTVGADRSDFPLLAKPYSIEELARVVRRELDGSA